MKWSLPRCPVKCHSYWPLPLLHPCCLYHGVDPHHLAPRLLLSLQTSLLPPDFPTSFFSFSLSTEWSFHNKTLIMSLLLRNLHWNLMISKVQDPWCGLQGSLQSCPELPSRLLFSWQPMHCVFGYIQTGALNTSCSFFLPAFAYALLKLLHLPLLHLENSDLRFKIPFLTHCFTLSEKNSLISLLCKHNIWFIHINQSIIITLFYTFGMHMFIHWSSGLCVCLS